MKIVKHIPSDNTEQQKLLVSLSSSPDLHLTYYITLNGTERLSRGYVFWRIDFEYIKKHIHEFIPPNEYGGISFEIEHLAQCDWVDNKGLKVVTTYSVFYNTKKKLYNVSATQPIIIENWDYKNCYPELEWYKSNQF